MEDIDPKAFLEELQKEKKIIEKYIKQLEDSIIDNETKYLLSTVNNGNIYEDGNIYSHLNRTK